MAVIMGGTTAFLHFGRLEGASDAVARSEVEASRDDALFWTIALAAHAAVAKKTGRCESRGVKPAG